MEVPVWADRSANLIAVARQVPAKKLAQIRTTTTRALQIATATVSVARSTKDRAFVEIRFNALAAQLAHSAWQILTAPQVVAVARIMRVNRRVFARIRAKLGTNVAVDLTAFQRAATKDYATM